MAKKALEGIKVIDLTSALSGPFATMFFADYGAEVIKVEPLGGEQSRSWGPFLKKSGESNFYGNFNRNKKGVSLNLKTEKGLQMLYDLVKDADFFWENYRGGVTKRLKIDYDTIKQINPNIIYVSGSGFGTDSPISYRPCYDIVSQAMAGMLNLTGYPDQDPVKVGPSVADHVSGIYQAVGALIALHHRDKTGEGQFVDVAMFDTIFSLLENAVPDYTVDGVIDQRNGNIDPSIAPFDVYKVKDGFCAVGVGNDRLWAKFCNYIGKPELLEDERFKTNTLRCENYKSALRDVMQEWAGQYTKKELEDMMDEAGIPCGPVMDMKEVIEHPQTAARDLLLHVQHPIDGDVEVQGVVAKMSETPAEITTAAPMVGQDNKEVFGLTDEEAKKLEDEGVISSASSCKM